MKLRKDISGKMFGRLLVIERFGNDNTGRNSVWKCACQCGNIALVSRPNLASGHTTSCGCYQIENQHLWRRTHGASRTPTYNSWKAMIRRCCNPCEKRYERYGGAGITVCERWKLSFEDFKSDMGLRPSWEHSIDRIDNAKGYFKENCRWATHIEQASNTSRNRHVSIFGETKTISGWARDDRCSITKESLRVRLNNGWNPEAALVTPRIQSNKYIKRREKREWEPTVAIP